VHKISIGSSSFYYDQKDLPGSKRHADSEACPRELSSVSAKTRSCVPVVKESHIRLDHPAVFGYLIGNELNKASHKERPV
jgi:hypothetical protein